MRSRLASLAAGLALTFAGSADAAVFVATFSGVVDSGTAHGVFGYAYGAPVDLAGKTITGTIRYDTSRLSACTAATSFFGCFVGPGLSMTQTINDVTELFAGDILPVSAPFNEVATGVQLYNLGADEVAFHTYSSLGDPGTVYRGRDAGVSIRLPAGALPTVDSAELTYSGPVTNGGLQVGLPGNTFSANTTSLYELTAGFYTQQASYQFSVTDFRIGAAVPEPSAWALMILGFGAAGLALRRRRAKYA